MITSEHEFDYTSISVIDEEGRAPDVEIIIADEGVYIQQFLNPDINIATSIFLTHDMFRDMILATQLPEGSYTVR